MNKGATVRAERKWKRKADEKGTLERRNSVKRE